VANVWNLNGIEGWNLRWRRRLFVWETNLLNYLLLIINPIRPTVEVDSWGWRVKEGDAFTVKSAYSMVSDLLIPMTTFAEYQGINFKAIWKCQAPPKVIGFVWLVLLNRVPTRDNLIRRRVIPEDGHRCCVFCGDSVESVPHLFLYYRFVLQLWERVFVWL
jgi:hypothetical protein